MGLLEAAGCEREIAATESLAIGWPGRSDSSYRDDDGTHARVLLGDGSRVIYREYATTTAAAAWCRAKEAFVFTQLAKAGLPTPPILAAVDGSPGVGGDPPAMLLGDAGGDPLEAVYRTVPNSQRSSLWSEVGATLQLLHSADVALAGYLADPQHDRPWMRTVPYFAKSLRTLRDRRPELASGADELLAMLRRDVAPYLEGRPRAICCGHYAMPAMMLERHRSGWRCVSWFGLGYYVSVGDPDRDLASVAYRCRNETGEELPASFYKAYGRRSDPVADTVYRAFVASSRLEDVSGAADRLRELLR